MTDSWRQLSPDERRKFLAATGKRRTGPHQFNRRALHWPFSGRCGLVRLKNDVSLKAAAKLCVWEDDA